VRGAKEKQIKEVYMKKKVFLLTMMVLALFAFVPSAWSQGVLDMPPNPVYVRHLNLDPPFTIRLSDISNDSQYDVRNGDYDGWCSEHNGTWPAVDGYRFLYDSTDSAKIAPLYTLPFGVNWNMVNYLLNNKIGTDMDVQTALWFLLGTQKSSDVLAGNALTMYNNAKTNGGSFPLTPGQVVAVLIYIDGFKGLSQNQSVRNQDTLIEVTVPPLRGCTLTPGYWKTHSTYGPAPYDDTWAKIGEETTFYKSGTTWYNVLRTPPKKGNAYYILAFQYIAARLNIEAGASTTPQVVAALVFAESFFNTYTPTDFPAAQRTLAINNAKVLDSYNNGYIGPGHCSD
jgi:hypothetical protein